MCDRYLLPQPQVHLAADERRRRADRRRNALALAIVLVAKIGVTLAFQSGLRGSTFGLVEHDNTVETDQQQLARHRQLAYVDRRPRAARRAGPAGDAERGAADLPRELVRANSTNSTDETGLDHGNYIDDDFTRDKNFTVTTNTELWFVKEWYDILLRACFVVLIVLFGAVGNAMIIYSMFKFKTIRSKPTNIFIFNTALADLLTSFVCPNTALVSSIYQMYPMGPVICRLEGFLKITFILVSAYSLIVLSVDWLLCVIRPFRKRFTLKQSYWTIGVIWFLSIVVASPLIAWRKLRERIWLDVVEVWCAEIYQRSRYYWFAINFLFIYLPICFMTIVLTIILLRMDKFEAKLKRSRATQGQQQQQQQTSLRLSITALPMFVQRSGPLTMATNSDGGLGSSSQASRSSNYLQTRNMKYRRRIMKILIFYLLTSVVCWSPLQFFYIYRFIHYGNEEGFPDWFSDAAFCASLFASLSGVMNPVIFGFLSEPFRRIITKSRLIRFFFKFSSKKRPNRAPRNNNNNNQPDANRRHMHLQRSYRSNPVAQPIRYHELDLRHYVGRNHTSPHHVSTPYLNQSRNGATRRIKENQVLRLSPNDIPMKNIRPAAAPAQVDTRPNSPITSSHQAISHSKPSRQSDLNNTNNHLAITTISGNIRQVSFKDNSLAADQNATADYGKDNACFEPDEQQADGGPDHRAGKSPPPGSRCDKSPPPLPSPAEEAPSQDDSVDSDPSNNKVNPTSPASERVKRVA